MTHTQEGLYTHNMSSTTESIQRPVLGIYETFRTEALPELYIRMNDKEDKPDVGKYDAENSLAAAGYKVCGAFALKTAVSPIEIRDDRNEIVIGQDELYMSIHMRKLSAEEANIGYVRSSLKETADYLASTDSGARTLAGLTYARLGRTAAVMGFEVSEILVREQSSFEPSDVTPVIAHTSIESFIDRY